MSDYTELLARLWRLSEKPKYRHSEADNAMSDAAAAIRDLTAALELERKAREEAETRSKEFAQAGAIRYAELAAKEKDRQYHMDAINRLASFLALSGTSFEVVQAAIDNMTRMAKAMPCGHPESLRVSSVESNISWCDLCDTRKQRNDAVSMERHYQQQRDSYALDIEELQEQIRQLNAAYHTETQAKILSDSCYENQYQRAESAERRLAEVERETIERCAQACYDDATGIECAEAIRALAAEQNSVAAQEGTIVPNGQVGSPSVPSLPLAPAAATDLPIVNDHLLRDLKANYEHDAEAMPLVKAWDKWRKSLLIPKIESNTEQSAFFAGANAAKAIIGDAEALRIEGMELAEKIYLDVDGCEGPSFLSALRAEITRRKGLAADPKGKP